MTDAKIEPLPCPFCRRGVRCNHAGEFNEWYFVCDKCGYESGVYRGMANATRRHNRVSRAAMKEAKNG